MKYLLENQKRLLKISTKRLLSSHSVTRNIKFFTENSGKVEINTKTFKKVTKNCQKIAAVNNFDFFYLRLLQEPLGRPLAMICSWLGANPTHLRKYVGLYSNLGFDVVTLNAEPYRMLRPKTSIPPLAQDLTKFLLVNDNYTNIALHGLSVGGFLWSNCLTILHKTATFDDVNKRIKSQVWDCVAGSSSVAFGVSAAMFPTSKIGFPLANKLLPLYYKLFHQQTLKHFDDSLDKFHDFNVTAPALVFSSSADLIVDLKMSQRCVEHWKAKGLDATWKCYHDAEHVQNFMKHKEEYTELVVNHLRKKFFIDSEREIKK